MMLQWSPLAARSLAFKTLPLEHYPIWLWGIVPPIIATKRPSTYLYRKGRFASQARYSVGVISAACKWSMKHKLVVQSF